MTDTKLKILEVLRIPIRMGKKYPGKPIMFKLQKIKHKEKPLKEARRKNTLPIKKTKIRTRSYLSLEIMQERRKRREILKVLKEKNHQPRILTKFNAL